MVSSTIIVLGVDSWQFFLSRLARSTASRLFVLACSSICAGGAVLDWCIGTGVGSASDFGGLLERWSLEGRFAGLEFDCPNDFSFAGSKLQVRFDQVCDVFATCGVRTHWFNVFLVGG